MIKTNKNYLRKFIADLDVCCISEHWLHSFDLKLLQHLHSDFKVFALVIPMKKTTYLVHLVIAEAMVTLLYSGGSPWAAQSVNYLITLTIRL